jgi:hypothetical protein
MAACLRRLPRNDALLQNMVTLKRQVTEAKVPELAREGLHRFMNEWQIGLGELQSRQENSLAVNFPVMRWWWQPVVGATHASPLPPQPRQMAPVATASLENLQQEFFCDAVTTGAICRGWDGGMETGGGRGVACIAPTRRLTDAGALRPPTGGT